MVQTKTLAQERFRTFFGFTSDFPLKLLISLGDLERKRGEWNMLLKRVERIERVQHLVYAGNYWLLSGVSIHSPDDWWLVLQAGSAAHQD